MSRRKGIKRGGGNGDNIKDYKDNYCYVKMKLEISPFSALSIISKVRFLNCAIIRDSINLFPASHKP
jgi:hypothetical protein